MKTIRLLIAMLPIVAAVGCGSGADTPKADAATTPATNPSAPPVAVTQGGQNAAAAADETH